MPSESDLHRSIYERTRDLPRRFPHVLIGPGDDCAAIRADAQRPLLVTTDQLVEGRHFLPVPATSIDRIARKAIARSVSDIAAMGGSPSFALATGLLPPQWPHAQELCERLQFWSEHFHCPLVGGDIATYSRTTEVSVHQPLVLTTTVAGLAHPWRGPVTRSGARPGDLVYITGRVGGSLQSGRHLTFSPRVRESQALCDSMGPALHAMIDVSDGVGIDAARIAEASGVRIELDLDALPLHERDERLTASPRREAMLSAVRDGEDYELLFVAGPDAPRPMHLPSADGGHTTVTLIGRVLELPESHERKPVPRCVGTRGENQEAIDLSEAGWEH